MQFIQNSFPLQLVLKVVICIHLIHPLLNSNNRTSKGTTNELMIILKCYDGREFHKQPFCDAQDKWALVSIPMYLYR